MTRRYGAGSVYPIRRRDATGEMVETGKWGGQWNAGRDETGARDRRTITPQDSEAAAWKALAAARGRSSSTKRRRGGETVGEFLERWLEDVVRKRRRERTYHGYRQIVTDHLAEPFGDIALRALTRRQVQAWVNRQTGAPLSIRHRVDCLRSALGWAVRWNLIDANPSTDLDLPTVPRKAIRALSPDDARKILAATSETWFGPLVTVALYTGLRQGELLGLRWQDVDLKAGTLTVHVSLARLPRPGGGTRYALDAPKSESSRRTVPLVPAVVDTLREHQRKQMEGPGSWKGLVFADPDRPIDGTKLTHHFQDALKAAKLPDMRWHDLRHATASLLISQGVPLAVVSSILGHSGIAITMDVYGHLTDETKRDATARLGRALGGVG